LKTYKYRLYPTKAQKQKLDENLNLCRVLYNTALSQRKTAYRQQRISLNYYDQASELKEVKECLPEYKYIHSQVLQDVLKRVDKAFQNFFRRVKLGEKPGYHGSKVTVGMIALLTRNLGFLSLITVKAARD